MLLKKKYNSLILVWITLTSTAPFIFYSWPGHPYKKLTFIGLFLMMFMLLLKPNNKSYDIKILIVLLIQIVYLLFSTIYHKDPSNISLVIQLISLYIIITFINLNIGFHLFIKSYIYIILSMGIGGTIIFFLHLTIGIKPLFSVDYSETGTSYFLWLTTTNFYFDVSDIRLLRYSGFFDEPGQFALFSSFAIFLNKIYLKNKKIEIGLIFVTLFTMSLAFYFVVLMYFLFFYLSRSSLKYIIVIAFTVLFTYIYISENRDIESVDKIYELTFKRFEFEGSELADNNRADGMRNDKEVFIKNPFLGVGTAKEKVYGSNLFSILARNGVIGTFFYYSLLIYMLYLIMTLTSRKEKILYFKIFLLIILNFYHRPEFSSVFTLIVFVSIIHLIKIKPNQINNTPINL